jgi:hypothetical protein
MKKGIVFSLPWNEPSIYVLFHRGWQAAINTSPELFEFNPKKSTLSEEFFRVGGCVMPMPTANFLIL